MYGWQELAQVALGVSVPPPTINFGNGVVVGSKPTAVVTVPTFPPTGLTGESAAVVVFLFISSPSGFVSYVTTPSGGKVFASDVIAAGAVTCGSLGL
jgi:hypothetical protein